MICETCEELRTADGNPNLYPYFCTMKERKIFNPHQLPKWCPKDLRNRRRARARKQDHNIQTDCREMSFIDGLKISVLPKYIAGVKARDPKKTDFDIPTIVAYAEGKLQKN